MHRAVIMLIACFVLLSACGNSQYSKLTADNEISTNEQNSEKDVAIDAYMEFLNGSINVESIDIDFITIPTREPDKRYITDYALFDSNGDLIPELHIKSARYYYILSYKDKELFIWKNLSPKPYYYAINNGAFLSWHMWAHNHDEFNYMVFDYLGNDILGISFSRYDDNQNGVFDDADKYLFDGVIVTKTIWEELAERYLYTDENGVEHIKNEIEWISFIQNSE